MCDLAVHTENVWDNQNTNSGTRVVTCKQYRETPGGRVEWSTRGREVESGRRGRYATWRDWIITNWDVRAGTRSEGGAAWRRTREQGQATDMSGSSFPKKCKNPKINDITRHGT